MKPLFYVLTILAIGAGIYFSSANKSVFEEQQKVRLDTIERNENLTELISETEEELRQEEDSLDSANRELAEIEANLDRLRADEGKLVVDLQRLEDTLESQKVTLDEAEEGRVAVENALRDMGFQGEVTMDTIKQRIQELEDQRKELETDITELDSNIGAAERQVEQNREKIASLSRRKAERDARIRRNAMESVVTSVDQEWGFVVIGAGSNSGFTPQTRLLIKRDGRMIGEVQPSSVEPTQTIAEIDYDSLAPGVRIQPGDRVILSDPAIN